MLSNTEQNKTESAVIEKLLTFKQVLETHPASNTLAHRFFLDVLKSILEETIHAIPFAFPVDEDTRAKYNFHLNQEVRLFHLPDDYELNQETIQKLLSFTYLGDPPTARFSCEPFYEIEDTLIRIYRIYGGIVLYQNNLHRIQWDHTTNEIQCTLIEDFDLESSNKLKQTILNNEQPRTLFLGHFPDATQQDLIAKAHLFPSTQTPRDEEEALLTVINLIDRIALSLARSVKHYQDSRDAYWREVLANAKSVGAGLLMQSCLHILSFHPVFQAVILGKIVMLASILTAIMVGILAISLGVALYHYISARQYADQCLTHQANLLKFVNLSKTYPLDTNTVEPNYETPPQNFDAFTDYRPPQNYRRIVRNDANSVIGEFTIKFRSVGSFFKAHISEIKEIAATEFQSMPLK
ncbi:MAG: hypothetical protein KBB94_09485 [Legionellaceae bacterium]|nr:hypothetical protein [Legionellaceae bacterium]MBP9775941.1 hypothetical protein [Legionellaceae bacterium]